MTDGKYKLVIEQAQVLKVETMKGSGLDREFVVKFNTPESSALQLGAFDPSTLFRVEVTVAE